MNTNDAAKNLLRGEPCLKLSLFRVFAVHLRTGEAPVRSITLSGRTRSLLALLALSRRTARTRSELADILWSRSGDAATSGTFNTALWRLRQAIEKPPLPSGGVILCDRNGQVSLCDGDRVQTDVDAYCTLVTPALAKPFDALDGVDIDRLRRGVALYAGDVLEGFVDDWALRERELRRRQQLNALGRLVQWSVLRGDAASGVSYAQAILDIDALREDVHRELMRLHVQAGQRAMALRQFEHCRDALRRELAIVPMRETMMLYQQIADGALVTGGTGTGSRLAVPFDLPSPASTVDGHAGPAAEPPRGDAGDLIAAARSTLHAADTQLQAAIHALPPAPVPAPRA